MKLITLFIQPHMEGKVIHALHDLEAFPGFTITEVRGQGRGRGAGGHYNPTEYDLTYQRHLQIQILCRDDFVAQITAVAVRAAHTGRKGDGIVFVTDVTGYQRIREFVAPAE